MIVTCPSCTTRYFADDAAIGPNGRSVRCAACGHSWFVEPQLVLDLTAPEDLLPESRPARQPLTRDQVERMRRARGTLATAKIREKQLDRSKLERIRASAVAWGGAGAAIAVAAGGATLFRVDIAQFWPEAASAYAAVGIPVNLYGLEFSDLEIERSYDGPTPVLLVSGQVRNLSGEAKSPPPLRFALRDGQAKELYRWVLRLDGQAIPAGGALPFETVIDNPPIQAEDLEATFASAKEALEAGAAALPPEQGPIAAPRGFTDEPLALEPESTTPADPHETSLAPPPPQPLRAGPVEGLAPRIDEGLALGALASRG